MPITAKENWAKGSDLEIIIIQRPGSEWYFPGKMYKVLGLVGKVRKAEEITQRNVCQGRRQKT